MHDVCLQKLRQTTCQRPAQGGREAPEQVPTSLAPASCVGLSGWSPGIGCRDRLSLPPPQLSHNTIDSAELCRRRALPGGLQAAPAWENQLTLSSLSSALALPDRSVARIAEVKPCLATPPRPSLGDLCGKARREPRPRLARSLCTHSWQGCAMTCSIGRILGSMEFTPYGRDLASNSALSPLNHHGKASPFLQRRQIFISFYLKPQPFYYIVAALWLLFNCTLLGLLLLWNCCYYYYYYCFWQRHISSSLCLFPMCLHKL